MTAIFISAVLGFSTLLSWSICKQTEDYEWKLRFKSTAAIWIWHIANTTAFALSLGGLG